MANDEEVVRQNYLASPKKQREQKWSPKISEYDAMLRSNAMIYNRLGDVVQAIFSTIQRDKGKPAPRYKGEPFPTPETVLEHIKQQEAKETGAWMISAWMPHASWENN